MFRVPLPGVIARAPLPRLARTLRSLRFLRAPARALALAGIALLGAALPPAARAFNGHQVSAPPLSLTLGPVGTVTQCDVPQTVAVTLANAASTPLEVALELGGLIDGCHAVGETRRTLTVPAQGRAETSFQFRVDATAYSAHYPVHVRATTRHGDQPVLAHAVDVFVTELPGRAPAAGKKSAPAAAAKKSAGANATTATKPSARAPAPTAPTANPAAAPAAPDEAAPLVLAPDCALALAAQPRQQVIWSWFDRPEVTLPVGWQGSDAQSAASFLRAPQSRGGEERPSLQMHPPYRGGTGTIFASYRLQLPAQTPLRLAFCTAIRDHGPKEPPSDGVTFRVWVDGQVLFERHSDAKTWQPGEADLSAFAGRIVTLRLESHPGPKRNTTCDSSYWGDPVVIAGPRPAPLSAAARAALAQRALAAVSAPAPTPAARADDPRSGLFTFRLAGDARAALVLGPNGLADGALAFAHQGRTVCLAGFTLAVLESRLGPAASELVLGNLAADRTADGRLRVVHRLRRHGETFDLTAELWADGPGLRVRVDSPARLTDLAPGAADRLAERVYFGHGYCITAPQAFRLPGGGHNLAASHVACDFAGGLSLLTASDTPPDSFEVEPTRRVYALHSHPGTTFTFVPDARGAFPAAIAFRALSEKRAAAGVAAKAGRFVFDFWGRSYADNLARLRRAVAYGLTDSLLVLHVWQRWGYDYRLPDIFPPDPKLGTLEDLQALARFCAEHGVLFAPHDNYIDFYPDADDFTYDHITFDAAGRPRKAWINNSRDAQSYQCRPDHVAPFLQRNLRLLVPALRPTSYFVDVFSSANVFDYYDRTGAFHSKLETQRHWGEAFAAIRTALGGHAPTISEAGGDYLIGWLDGADAQFLGLSPRPRLFQLGVTGASWARVPWLDAVHHARFSLHGVGYSSRYQGGASRALTGIESDDYLGAEILTGHALMTDLAAGVRGDVRKYWLAQDFIRRIATDDLAAVAYADGDPQRLTLTWSSGAVVHVNRSGSDWSVDGQVLPPWGYWARQGDVESAIARRDGAVVEWSRRGDVLYVNGRGPQPDSPLPIRPSLGTLRSLGGRRFVLPLQWDAAAPAPRDFTVFLHLYQPQKSRLQKIGWVAYSAAPEVPTSRWHGRVTTGAESVLTVPDDCPPGEYEITVGLYDPRTRGAPRVRLLGDEDAERRIKLGTLVVEGNKSAVTGLRVVPGDETPAWQVQRLAPNLAPTDFGALVTDGAFRLARHRPAPASAGAAPTAPAAGATRATPAGHLGWDLQPLPDSPAATVRLRLDRLPGGPAPTPPTRAQGFDEHGQPLGEQPLRIANGIASFVTEPGVFYYWIH